MNIQIFDSYELLSEQIAEEIIEDLGRNPEQLLCIAAGHTSLGVFRQLVCAYERGQADFSHASFVAMDEWLHMSWETPESCGSFLIQNFLSHVNYPQENICLWDGTAADTDQECQRVLHFIEDRSGCMDYLVLGVGMNGHLALNEPGVDFGLSAHTCTLDPVTQKVGQKYFTESTSLTGGITLGIADFKKAKRTVLAVSGSPKATLLKQLTEKKAPTSSLPATALYEFKNASIYCDQEAAGLLDN